MTEEDKEIEKIKLDSQLILEWNLSQIENKINELVKILNKFKKVNSMTLEEKELKIIDHYGVIPQLKYFQSEVFELNEAIIEYEIRKNHHLGDIAKVNSISKSEIKEEIADVQMMLNQFKKYYGISDITIDIIMNEKANRQLERIKNSE